MIRTKFTELVGCSAPIQLAGMPGVATPQLAAEVSEAGGLGMVSGVRMSPDGLLAFLDSVRQLTKKPFGVNFLMPFIDPACIPAAASKADVVEFFYGDPRVEFVEIVHKTGALAAWQVGTKREALDAVQVGCDFIIVQGTEAGGHVRGQVGLLPLLAEILDHVEVPVVAAGGIATGRDLAAVLAAGADGARIGTRFVASTESGAHPAYVQALLEATAEDTVITEAFSATWPNAPHRVLRACVEAANSMEDPIVAEIALPGGVLKVPRYGSPVPTLTTTGAIQAMAMYAGQSVSSTCTIRNARLIVQELVDTARSHLQTLRLV